MANQPQHRSIWDSVNEECGRRVLEHAEEILKRNNVPDYLRVEFERIAKNARALIAKSRPDFVAGEDTHGTTVTDSLSAHDSSVFNEFPLHAGQSRCK